MWNCGVRGLLVVVERVRGNGVRGKGGRCIGGGVIIRFVS
jgi:hypothetical protein